MSEPGSDKLHEWIGDLSQQRGRLEKKIANQRTRIASLEAEVEKMRARENLWKKHTNETQDPR